MRRRAFCAGGAALALMGCGGGRGALAVSVAASLQDAMKELGPEFERTHAGTAVQFNFGGSGTLQQQIENGAPADVFLAAGSKPMDGLAAKGLIAAGTRRDLLRNRVVLIAPAGSVVPGSFEDLSKDAVKVIALGDPESVPAGDYGRQTLQSLGLWERVRPKLVLAKDVRQVLGYVETGNADAGIVYATDAREAARVRVAATAPEGSHREVVYPVAAMREARNAEAARAFVEFLGSPRAGEIFARYGFSRVER